MGNPTSAHQAMYPSKGAREFAILLRISRELDIVGDVSATVDNPSELLAWATILPDPTITAHKFVAASPQSWPASSTQSSGMHLNWTLSNPEKLGI